MLQHQGSNRLSPVNGAIADVKRLLQGSNMQSRIVDAVVKNSKAPSEQPEPAQTSSSAIAGASAGPSSKPAVVKSEDAEVSLDLPTGPFLGDNDGSEIFPLNAYVHLMTHLK